MPAPAAIAALQRGAGNALVARWLAESDRGQGPDPKLFGDGSAPASVVVAATITDGGVSEEVREGETAAASSTPAKGEVTPTGSTDYDGQAAGSGCTPAELLPKDLDWNVKDAGTDWGVQVGALRTSGLIEVRPNAYRPTEMVTPNTANPVDGGNIENNPGSHNHWEFAATEMRGYHAPNGGRSAYWHSNAASYAHEYEHWTTDWMKTALGGNWPQANKDLDAITTPKAGAADATAAKTTLQPQVDARLQTLNAKVIQDWLAVPDEPGVAGSNGYIAGQRVLDDLIKAVETYAKTKGW